MTLEQLTVLATKVKKASGLEVQVHPDNTDLTDGPFDSFHIDFNGTRIPKSMVGGVAEAYLEGMLKMAEALK